MPETKVTVALSFGSSRKVRRMAAIGSSTEPSLFDKGNEFCNAAGENHVSTATDEFFPVGFK